MLYQEAIKRGDIASLVISQNKKLKKEQRWLSENKRRKPEKKVVKSTILVLDSIGFYAKIYVADERKG